MNEKTTPEAVPLLRDHLQQRPRKSNISTVLGLLAAVCLIGFFHHRPHPVPNDIEEPAQKPWTWNDVRIQLRLEDWISDGSNRSNRDEIYAGSLVMKSLSVQDSMFPWIGSALLILSVWYLELSSYQPNPRTTQSPHYSSTLVYGLARLAFPVVYTDLMVPGPRRVRSRLCEERGSYSTSNCRRQP
jgi:hypothetical protein